METQADLEALPPMPKLDHASLSFVKLIVADIDRMYAFYRDVFDLEQVGRVSTGVGDDALEEIIAKPAANRRAPSIVFKRYLNRPQPAPGESMIGFNLPDVDAAVARAVAAGGKIVRAAEDRPEFRVRVALLADHEGHMLELVQPL